MIVEDEIFDDKIVAIYRMSKFGRESVKKDYAGYWQLLRGSTYLIMCRFSEWEVTDDGVLKCLYRPKSEKKRMFITYYPE